MRAIICGGGTAGHVTPGIAVAETILSHDSSSDILFIGREGGNENRLIKHHGLNLKTLRINGFSRKSLLSNGKNAFLALKALNAATKILSDFAPDAVIGTGGYVCWPVIRAAQRKKIPTVIHESNVFPGLTTRLLYKGCDRTLLNFPGSEKEFKSNANLVTVGNPLLSSLDTESKASAREKLGFGKGDFVIISFGGSGGSMALNENVVKLMRNYSSRLSKVKHVHACGTKYFDAIRESDEMLTSGVNGCKIYPFIDNMPLYIKAADVAICRCGAMTLSEVAAAETVPILIPSPNVTDNHQYKNARLFSDVGAGILIEESELNERALLDAVRRLEYDKVFYLSALKALKAFHFKDSNERFYNEILKITR